jgi:putative MATE family efflux protein
MTSPPDIVEAKPTVVASEPAGVPPVGWWSAIREALRGSHQDFTEGPIPRAILLLAVPMVLEMALESVFAVVDVFFVARLGAGAVATVGLTEALLAVLYAVAIGLSVGATATVARRIGEHDLDGAAHAAVQCVALGLATAIVLGTLGAIFAPRLLALMGASSEVIALGSGYSRIALGGCGSVIMLFLVNAVFRGAGDAAIAMRVLWLANGINIILDPCLIFGLGPFPHLGVTGAAVATATGRTVGALFALYQLTRPGRRIIITRKAVHIDVAQIWRLLRLSSSGVFQVLVGTASWIGLVRIMSAFGSVALAGYTIGIRIIIFAILPSWGLSNAAATLVGQALGAKRPDRASQAVWLTALYDCCVLSVIGVLFVAAGRPIVGLFTDDPAVRDIAARCLRIVAIGFPFYAYEMVITQAFNGAGDTWTPTWLNFAVFWLWEIPLAYFLARVVGLGPTGVFIAITVAFSTLAVAAALLFSRGRWKNVTV